MPHLRTAWVLRRRYCARADKQGHQRGIVIRHVAFVEALSQLEGEGAAGEWRETWAGLLVLRLYHLWQLNPHTAGTDTPGAGAVRAVVEELPESASVKIGLIRILDALRVPHTPRPATITRLLRNYAASLARRAQWSLAEDVYQTAGFHPPGVRSQTRLPWIPL